MPSLDSVQIAGGIVGILMILGTAIYAYAKQGAKLGTLVAGMMRIEKRQSEDSAALAKTVENLTRQGNIMDRRSIKAEAKAEENARQIAAIWKKHEALRDDHDATDVELKILKAQLDDLPERVRAALRDEPTR